MTDWAGALGDLPPEVEAVVRTFVRSLAQVVRVFQKKAADPTPPERNIIPALCDDLGLLLADAKKQALWIMQEKGVLAPIFGLLGRQGIAVGVQVTQGMPTSFEMQMLIASGVASTIKVANIDACVFQMEAWLADFRQEDREKVVAALASGDLHLRDRPDRVEVVYTRASTRLASALRVYSIERDEQGKAVALHDLDSMKLFGAPQEDFNAELARDNNPLLCDLYSLIAPAQTGDASQSVH